MRDHSIPGTFKKDYITSADWQTLAHEGKLKPIALPTLHCYFCNTLVTTTETDGRSVQLPHCTACGIYYEFQWILQEGDFGIIILPREYRYQHTEANEIGQQTQATHPHPEQTSEQQNEQQDEQPHANPIRPIAPEHKDVRGQILALMAQRLTPIKTQELLNNINASRQSIMTQINKLIAQGKIRKVQRATYQLIPTQNHRNVN